MNPQAITPTIRKITLGLVAFLPAARVLATDVNQVVEKFVKGRVAGAASNMIVVETLQRGEIVLLLSPATKIWGDNLAGGLPIEIGDEMMAWVSPRRGGVCEVEQIWLNWLSLQGRAMNIRDDKTGLTFEYHTSDREALTIRIDPRTLISTRDRSAAFADGALSLAEGEAVQLSGRKLKDGSVLAATLSLPQR